MEFNERFRNCTPTTTSAAAKSACQNKIQYAICNPYGMKKLRVPYDDKIPDEYCKGDREARLSFYYGMPSTGVYPNNAALSFTSKGQVALFDVA